MFEAVGSLASIAANSFGGNEASRFVGVGLLTHSCLALPALVTSQPIDYFRDAGLPPLSGAAFLIAMVGVASGILGGLCLLFRDEHSFDEPRKRRKRLLVSNWK